MEDIEEIAIITAHHPPKWWFRYVDDSHTCLKREHVNEFHQHLNSINPNIQFTVELEDTTEQGLPFLDTITTRSGTRGHYHNKEWYTRTLSQQGVVHADTITTRSGTRGHITTRSGTSGRYHNKEWYTRTYHNKEWYKRTLSQQGVVHADTITTRSGTSGHYHNKEWYKRTLSQQGVVHVSKSTRTDRYLNFNSHHPVCH